MKKIFVSSLVLCISSIAFGADNDSERTTTSSTFVRHREIVKEEASDLNREVVKPLIEETKKTYTTEVKPVVQQTGTSAVDAKNTIVETASNLNQLRKKFRF